MSHQDWMWVAYGGIGLVLFGYMLILMRQEERKEREKLAAGGGDKPATQ
ncbi:hypothetical protein FACS1894107_08540 [Planctomycetales bacterium]|nr:hypothetical protein FACS1894107_08540 [Planctomycetales bacterium]GHV19583.1 hypothetical protein AGMMS49959_05000 [Planctomycetales bacterium]